jgi:hypothetical protein
MSAASLQVRALGLEFGAREKLFLQGARLFRQIGNEAVQILRCVTEPRCELIEGYQRRIDLFEPQIPLLHRAHLAQPDLTQLSR